jgi:hypothetical protein
MKPILRKRVERLYRGRTPPATGEPVPQGFCAASVESSGRDGDVDEAQGQRPVRGRQERVGGVQSFQLCREGLGVSPDDRAR